MSRYVFPPGSVRPARLHAVRQRPLENLTVFLLRLEFEVFEEVPVRILRSTGKIACRDLVVGRGLDLTTDLRIRSWASALALPDQLANNLKFWLSLGRKNQHLCPWIKITFGRTDSLDYRTTFQHVESFDPAGYSLRNYDYDLDEQWVSVGVVAQRLDMSEASVRRRVSQHLAEFGEQLERRTAGNHRRVNWLLFSNLVNETA